MKTLRLFPRLALWALCLAVVAEAPAAAMPVATTPVIGAAAVRATPVASDCYSVGQEVAAQQGGTLAKASQSTQGGQPVCVIVVLVPGKDGQRPRRSEIVVPQN